MRKIIDGKLHPATPAQRAALKRAVREFGEPAVHAILDAVIENSERPFRKLAPELRARFIKTFREFQAQKKRLATP